MTLDEIKQLIQKDEHRCLELKKSTGELRDGMQSACAFLNTEGGWLIFGVTPNSLKLSGQIVNDSTQRDVAQALAGIEPTIDARAQYIPIPESNGKQIIAIHFEAWKDGLVPYTFLGRPYYRLESCTRAMPREMYDERLRNSNPNRYAWETQVAKGTSITDLNEERIRSAVRLGVIGGRINASAEGDKIETLLTKFKILRNMQPTNAAVALFGNQIDDYPQFMLRMARFKGNDKLEFVDSKHAIGNFFDLLDAGIEFCFKHLNLSGKVVGLRREEHLEIPIEALREALTNALCHRRYDNPSTSVSLAIYDNRIEIINPGHFPASLTPENIKEPHESIPYNIRIAQVLYQSTYLENWGTGVRRMVESCRKYGLPDPEFTSDHNGVCVRFWKSAAMQQEAYTIQKNLQKSFGAIQKTIQKDSDTIQKAVQEALSLRNISITDLQMNILVYFAIHPEATRKDYITSQSNISEGGTISNITRLQELGLLRREGGKKDGRWIVFIDDENNCCL